MTYQKEFIELMDYWRASGLAQGEWQKAMYHHAKWMQRQYFKSLDRDREHRWTEVANACLKQL